MLFTISIFSACGTKPPSESEASQDPPAQGQPEVFVESASEEPPIPETSLYEPVTGEQSTPFAVYRESDGYRVAIGDKREDIAAKLGPDERFVLEFEEDNTERVDYWDTEGIYINYDKGGIVREIRIDNTDWKIYNGVTIGNTIENATKDYPAEKMHKYPKSSDIFVAYETADNIIDYNEQVPYAVWIAVRGDKVERITILDNTVKGKIF